MYALPNCPHLGCDVSTIHSHGTDQRYQGRRHASGDSYKLKGYCPSCGNNTLTLFGGVVVCQNEHCEKPDALDKIISDPHISKHIVINKWDHKRGVMGFSAKHPIHERVDGELFNCAFSQAANSGEFKDVDEGRYYVYLGPEGKWRWEEAPTPEMLEAAWGKKKV